MQVLQCSSECCLKLISYWVVKVKVKGCGKVGFVFTPLLCSDTSFVNFQLRATEEGLTRNHTTQFSCVYTDLVYMLVIQIIPPPLFPRYIWTQTLGEVSVTVPVPPGTKSRDVVSVEKDIFARIHYSITGQVHARVRIALRSEEGNILSAEYE